MYPYCIILGRQFKIILFAKFDPKDLNYTGALPCMLDAIFWFVVLVELRLGYTSNAILFGIFKG